MFRRMIAMLMLLILPILGLADEYVPYEVYTFAGHLPERLTEPLSALIPDESRIVSGAAIRHNGDHFGDEPEFLDSYTALVLVDSAEGLRLYAAAWVENLPWQVNDYTRFLRQTQNVSVSLYKPDAQRIPVFSVDYYFQDGLVSDLMIFRGNRLWQLSGHIDEAAGVTIAVDMCTSTVIDEQGQDTYSCTLGFWMDYMTSIDELPTSREEAAGLGTAAHAAYAANVSLGLSYTSGANLRQRPTSSSESLGLYYSSVPLTLTGEQVQGRYQPWYKVRIGSTEGWMSGGYVYALPAQYYPVPLGRTVDGCPMYAAPGDAHPLAQLTQGFTFHILTEYQDMYHICIPGEISWNVAVDGMYGYIPKEGVLTGFSPSALDALENAR